MLPGKPLEFAGDGGRKELQGAGDVLLREFQFASFSKSEMFVVRSYSSTSNFWLLHLLLVLPFAKI